MEYTLVSNREYIGNIGPPGPEPLPTIAFDTDGRWPVAQKLESRLAIPQFDDLQDHQAL